MTPSNLSWRQRGGMLFEGLGRWTTIATATALLVAAWLGHVLGHPLPDGISRGVVLFGVAALASRLAREALRLGRGELRGLEPAAGRWLLAILALGVVTAFVGLGHEIGGRYFGDEGTFLANAERMNEGRLFRPWFIYPHLLYTLDAVALWVASLFPGLTAFAAQALWGVEGELAVGALVTRWVTAVLVALTPLVVFRLGRWLAGVPGGLAGALLAALSPLWIEVGHQSISDVPAGFFATLCLGLCAELLVRPSPRLWILAGLAAGLAAGSKYPAGLVALAIVAVWVRQVASERKLSAGLAFSTASALVAFVAATPSFVVHHDRLISPDGPDLLFGARLYAEAGWAGVVRGSNLLYYWERLADGFGVGLLLLGGAGLLLLPRDARGRLVWLLPFPVLYGALLLALNVALPRNLMPVLPFVAGILGCGLVAAGQWILRRPASSTARRGAVSLLAALALGPIVATTTTQLARFARPTTRDVAADWLQSHLPPGSQIVKEHYTPVVRYPLFARQPRFVVKLWPDELRDPRHDFVLVASEAYDRYLEPHNLHQEEFVHFARRYRELFEQLDLVREFRPGRWRAGPTIKLFRVDPDPVEYLHEVTISAAEARLADDAMRREDDSLEWLHDQGWALFKAHLAAGAASVRLMGSDLPARATLRVTTRDGVDVATVELRDGIAAAVHLPHDEKYFAYVVAPTGSRIAGLTWSRPET